MKKSVLLFAFIAVSGIIALPQGVHAQVNMPVPEVKPCEQKGREETRWMHKNLYLNVDQYSEVQNLNAQYSCKEDSLEHTLNKQALAKEKLRIKKDKDAAIKNILDEGQYKQYITHKDTKVVQKKSPFQLTD